MKVWGGGGGIHETDTDSLKPAIVYTLYWEKLLAMASGNPLEWAFTRITVCDRLTIYTQRTFLELSASLLVILVVLPACFLLSVRIRAC